MEKVGNVILNDKFFTGGDTYSDGDIENVLLDIVKNNPVGDYDRIINDMQNWAVLYHLSPLRTNVIDWMESDKSLKVLEVGSGCGAITGKMSEKFGSVTCIELSKRRSLINAYRNRDKDNIEIMLGNFLEVEPQLTEKYDIITLIGVLEYSKLYIGGKRPFCEFLEKLKKHLAPEGKIVIAIENKYGLKYWAGCVEDHKGKIYEGIEGYLNTDDVYTFSKDELEKVIKESGLKVDKFYYPYPDYKFPTSIYSDDYLPGVGELNNNYNNFDANRIVTFDESKVFDTIISDNKFPFFSNSFIVFATL